MNNRYFLEIALYRGFAIFTIVLIHMLLSVGGYKRYGLPNNDGIIHKFALSFLTDNTSLFVFISGFLFYYVFYKRNINFREFYIKNKKHFFTIFVHFTFYGWDAILF